VIGDVRMMRSTFGFAAPFDAASRLFAPELGGGGILDVGCYTVSMAVLVARAIGAATADATVSGAAHIGTTGVDEWAAATIKFGDRFVAEVECAVSLHLGWGVKVFGSTGTITVGSPWGPDRGPGIVISRPGQADDVRRADATRPVFPLLVETVARHIDDRESPTMPWADTMATMRILDRWLAAVGVVYPG
jgi:predicted dehydrogenase